MENVRGKRIYVGLSGGVDSAVSLALLQRAGALVTGVFIKGWYPPGLPCTWASDRRDAMRVAARLQVPFKTLDASATYKKYVIDYLLAEYRRGRTPNPDVMCNRAVKFGVFHDYALSESADAIATGHYVSGEKDQRYFLWAVPPRVLASAVFPLTGLEKPFVRRLAAQFRLPVAQKKDSQGVCFLGAVSVDDFLRSEFETREGVAQTREGLAVGTHAGAMLYTLGERIALKAESGEGPWYVVAKDIAANTLTVSHTPAAPASGAPTAIPFEDANWHLDPAEAATALVRYRGTPLPGRVQENAFVPLTQSNDLAVPGQSIVFYNAAGTLVGGGIIAA
jgi:tRNA-specific 2-thiouridylase